MPKIIYNQLSNEKQDQLDFKKYYNKRVLPFTVEHNDTFPWNLSEETQNLYHLLKILQGNLRLAYLERFSTGLGIMLFLSI